MILIIDNYDSFTYNLFQLIATQTSAVEVIRNDQLTLSDITALSPLGIIISPGPGRPEAAGLGVEIVKQFASSIPILGVCLGHQIIAQAFGGKVTRANIAVHGKQTLIFHHRQLLYSDMPLPFNAGRYHSLLVEREHLPECLVIEAENEQGLVMGIRHQQYPTFGLQFHPESILTPQGDRLIRNFLHICKRKVEASC